MYLLKRLGYEPLQKKHLINNGWRLWMSKDGVIPYPGFWGQTEINLGIFADTSKFEPVTKSSKIDCYLTYANEYFVEDLSDRQKKIIFNVSQYQPDNVEGYIIFVQSQNDIKTNGKKIYQNHLTDIIALLKEGEYLEFDGQRAEVINGKLYLQI